MSYALGQVLVPLTGTGPKLRLGFTTDWYASELRRDERAFQRMLSEGRSEREALQATTYPLEGLEFAIRRFKVPGPVWMMRFSASAVIAGKPGPITYPPSPLDSRSGRPERSRRAAPERPTDGWLELRLKAARHVLPFAGEFDLVLVTHAFGFEAPGEQEMLPETRRELEAAGCRVLTTTHVLSGAERGLSTKFGGVHPVEVIAHALRMFGQGVKVGVEVSVMALDAGTVPYGRDILAVGGSSEGADTAIVVRPAHANAILETRVVEILCMPRA